MREKVNRCQVRFFKLNYNIKINPPPLVSGGGGLFDSFFDLWFIVKGLLGLPPPAISLSS